MAERKSLEEIHAEERFKNFVNKEERRGQAHFTIIFLMIFLGVGLCFSIPNNMLNIFSIWFIGGLFLIEMSVKYNFPPKIEFSGSRERTNALLKDINTELKLIKSTLEDMLKKEDK